MGKLDGKVAIVTGGARGQGGAEAALFRAEGAEVVVTDVLVDDGELLAKEIGATFIAHDVRSEEEWAEVVRQTLERHGRIDVLVNNAGIFQRVKLVDTDMQMYGPSKNARTFVVISDGQVWSGIVQRAINEAAKRGIAVDVIGVGTSNGGMIPLPRDDKGIALAGFEPIRSTIDRTSLREIARAGNGEYFEIGTSPDEQIAARIIQNAARRSGNQQVDESLDELYWYLLVAAAVCLGLGVLFVKQKLQLGFGLAAALLLLVLISGLRS